MSTDTQLTTAQPRNVREYLALPTVKSRFEEVLRARAPQFMSALITLSQDQNLSKCDPRSVIGAAMAAATLDLPIEKSLGQAHIVSYGNQAQFQLGWKAYIQLAHRSGQYARLNAKPINAEAFAGYDEVGEPIIEWSKLDETLPPVGYAFAFKLINGFAKICYWPKAKVEAHAKRFSQAYKAGRQSSPWFSNFDSMALKTVVMNELRQWGVLSVQMQTALGTDQAIIRDVDAAPEFIDNDSPQASDDAPPERPAPPPRKPRGARAAMKTAEPVVPEVAPAEPAAPEPTAEPAPEPEQPADEIPGDAPAKRTTLNDKEIVEGIFTLDSETGPQIHPTKGADGNAKHYVSCVVSNDQFENLSVYDWNGAPDGVLNPLWKAGASVKLRLLGKLQGKIGKVAAMVEGIG